MDSHFIKNLNLTNFKCFKKLDIEGFKRVNLISGKNNIGKTSLMEAIELSVSSENTLDLAYNIYEMMRRRQLKIRLNREKYFELDFIYNDSSNVTIIINNKEIKIEYLEHIEKTPDEETLFEEEDLSVSYYQPSLKLSINKDSRIFTIDRFINRPNMIRRDRFSENKAKINFITSATTDERDIAIFYGKLIDLNKEEFLNKSLRIFDENIVALKQKATERDIVLKVQLKNRELPVLLSSLGEGINRYIAIICAIWASQDSFLFIDEIENGIHYTNYEKLWKIIFETSKMANCQIFVTTHSKECIESFNHVNENNEGSYYEFYRNQKTNLITAKQRDNSQLNYALTHGGEIRGE